VRADHNVKSLLTLSRCQSGLGARGLKVLLRRIATPVTLPTSSAVTVKSSTLPKIRDKIETKLNQQLNQPTIKHTNKPKGKQNKRKKKTLKN